ncbi:hypothetical protein G9F72_013510 [Clostridium estertheticum]|uniref:hypothetical protein n=1 Tax=Clostridium estertheticum TaxID=238834 RepID=UPI0013E9778A|nr:hypothetical protein [Clostridium estertheticum]MBZ9687344.1 hypothetical protein [Clostridium estertheticum]
MWNAQYIKPLLQGKFGYEKRIEAAFVQARLYEVTVIHMSVSIREEVFYDGSIEELVQAVKRIHKSYALEVIFILEIAFISYTPIDEINEKLDRFLDQHYFKSIDMFGLNVSSWNSELYSSMLGYIGNGLNTFAIISLIVGIIYLIASEFIGKDNNNDKEVDAGIYKFPKI